MENRLLKLINSKLGYNLKEKVTPVVKFNKLPPRGIKLFRTQDGFYEKVELFGPYYIFDIPEGIYLAQQRQEFDKWIVYDLNQLVRSPITENRFLSIMGIRFLGLSLDVIKETLFG